MPGGPPGTLISLPQFGHRVMVVKRRARPESHAATSAKSGPAARSEEEEVDLVVNDEELNRMFIKHTFSTFSDEKTKLPEDEA